MIDEAIRRGDIKLAPASEKHVKMANDVQNDFYNKLIGLGMNEQEALSASILMKNFALKRTVSPERFKNWYDKIVVTNKPQSQVGAVMQNALHQSAMYKSPKQNFSDFYNQVFEKEKDAKENDTNLKKSYFEYNDENTNVRVPHDTIIHDNNKHNLSSSEWETLFNNLANPSSAVLSNKPRFDGTPVLLKYNIANKSYGVVVEFFENKKPIITTAFTDKEKNVDNWLKKNSHSQAKNTSSVTTKGMLLSNDYNNIINYVKEKLNPNVNNHEEGIYVNGKFIDFDWLEEKLYALNKLAKNLRPEGELQENYDGWTVSYKNDKNAKERKHLYNLKNKLINKYGTFTGNIHKFPKGYGIEYSINGKGSFHKFVEDFITVKKYTLEQAIKKLSNREKQNFKFSFDYNGNLVINKKNEVKYLSSDDIKESFRKNNIEFDFEKYSNKLNIDYINNDIQNIEKLDVEKLLEVKKELSKEYIEKANYYKKEIKKQKEKLSKIPKTRKKTIEKEKQELYLLEKRFDYYNNQNANKTINKLLEIKNQAIKCLEQLKEINSIYKKLKKNGYISQNNELKELSQISKENKRNINLTSDDIKQLEKLYDNGYILDRLNKHDIHYQQENSSVAPGTIEETIQDKFGCSVDELIENIKQDIINTLSDYDVSDSEFSIQDIKLYGSYSKGTNKETSDLDFIVQYDGSMREDSAFNILHDVEHTIEDKDGNKVLIDINPINVNDSGTINEHVEYMNSLDDDNNTYFQSAYHGTPHKFDEFSTEHIGTGEGAQAHGWGLYFAGNKDISENYRRNLTQSVGDIIYNGKKLDINSNEYETISAIWNFFDAQNDTFEKAQKAYIENYKRYAQSDDETIREFAEKKIRVAENINYKKIKYDGKGQLFEVDIPENDALLDEDLTFNEQPKKVQENLKKLWKEKLGRKVYTNKKSLLAELKKKYDSETYNIVEKLLNKGLENLSKSERNAIPNSDLSFEDLHKLDYFNLSGEDIYFNIRNNVFEYNNKFNKDTSLLLNEYGIKGITYDGRQDGRCYVIFDDKAINVIKTYYQSANNNAVDLTDDFDRTPTLEDVKNYINEIVENGTKFATLSPNWFVDVKGGSKKKDHIIKSSNFKNMNKAEKRRHNKYVMSLEKLLANAEYIGEKENTKQDKKPNVEKYHYFKTNVKIGNKTYQIIFDTEEYKNDKSSSSANVLRSVKNLNEDTNSITDNSEDFNPKTVHLYNITEYKDNTYYQSDSEDVIREKLSNENIQNKIDELSQRIEKLAEEESELDNTPIIEAMLVDIERLENFMAGDNSNLDIIKKIMGVNEEKGVDLGQAIGKYKARKEQEIQNYRGYFVESDKVNILGIGQMSDSSTIIHELGHLFLNGMNEFAKYDEVSKRQLDAINNWLGYNGVAYTRAQHEKFECLFVL